MKALTTNDNSKKYGVTSLMAMIIGVVIGSGIYVKNVEIMEATESALAGILGWLIVGLIVISMTFAFMEVASTTNKTGEIGTLGTWTQKLIGRKSAKFISMFIALFYFPTVLVAFSHYATSQIMGELGNATIAQPGWAQFGAYKIIAIMFLGAVLSLNLLSIKGGKIAQIFGTSIKLIPLLIVMFMFIVLLFVSSGTHVDFQGVFDPTSDLNKGLDNNSLGSLIMLTLPAIMFTFNGFIFSASLQPEAKTKRTYKTALTISIFVIAAFYIFTTISVFSLGDHGVVGGGGFSVSYIIRQIAGPHGHWVGPLITSMIFISILSGLSGSSINMIRNMSALSEQNYVADRNGFMITKNTETKIAQNAGLIGVAAIVFWFVIFSVGDAVMLTQNGASHSFLITNRMSNFSATSSFIIYAVILSAALANRKSGKADVEKQRSFIPAVIVSIPLTAFVGGYELLSIFGLIDPSATDWTSIYFWMIPMTIVIGLLVIVLITWITEKDYNSMTKQELKKKQKYIKSFTDKTTEGQIGYK